MDNDGKSIVFDPRKIAEIIIKDQGIHEGIFNLRLEFSLASGIMSPTQDVEKLPAIMVGISGIGIQKTEEPGEYSVDAAKVNPKRKKMAVKTKLK